MDTPKIDLRFPLTGREIPLDHGYLLFAALSSLLERPDDPWLHASEKLAIHNIRGRYIGPGLLPLTPESRLSIRLPAALLPRFLPLAGKAFPLGDERLRIGIPQPAVLIPAPNLYAHLVTTKNGQDEVRFDEEIARQLTALGLRGKPQRGPRRTFRVKDMRVVAHTLLAAVLNISP